MTSRALLAGAACLVLLAATQTAEADPARPAPRTPPVTFIDDLQLGRLLIDAGRLGDAKAVLERAQPSDEVDAIERQFLLGRVAMLQGDAREAIDRFESILAVRPDLTRVRLELAAAYHAAGRERKSRRHFEAALADRPPASIEHAVRDFLRQIDARRRWSSSLSIGLAPETNPNKRTTESTISLAGIPFVLDEDARAASGTALLVSSGLSFSPAISDDLHAVLAASAAARLYRKSSWNDISGEGEMGLTRLFDQARLAGGLRIGRRWLANRIYNDSIGPWARGRYRMSNTLEYTLDIDADAVRHDGFADRDGLQFGFQPGLFYTPDRATALEAVLDLGATTARKRRHRIRTAGIRVGVYHTFSSRLVVASEISLRRQWYGAPDPLFERTRIDTTASVSIRFQHRELQHAGFTPYIGYSFEINRSTLPLHAYRNHAANLGIARSF